MSPELIETLETGLRALGLAPTPTPPGPRGPDGHQRGE